MKTIEVTLSSGMKASFILNGSLCVETVNNNPESNHHCTIHDGSNINGYEVKNTYLEVMGKIHEL